MASSSSTTSKYVIYSYKNNPRVWKAQIAAAFSGESIDYPEFKFPEQNHAPEFKAQINPNGKVPALMTPDGPIWESNAILRYFGRLAGTKLYGKNPYEAGLVDQWIDWSVNELENPSKDWLFPVLIESIPYVPATTRKAKKDVRKAMAILNEHLWHNQYMVGQRFGLADIALFCSLYRLYEKLFDDNFRRPYGNVNRWFELCLAHPMVSKFVGEFTWCEKMATAPNQDAIDAKEDEEEEEAKEKAKQRKKGGKKEQQHKEKEKEKAEPKDEEPEEDEEHEEEPAAIKKLKAELDALPKSKFNLEDWKRYYSNAKDTRGDACPHFWSTFDPEGYSLWFADYKYPEQFAEQKKFMVSNLIGGLFQRAGHMSRYAFASMLVFGEEPKMSLNGVWLFRGTKFPALFADVVADAESYTWTKVDLSNAQQKALVEDYFCWNGKFEGSANKGYAFDGNTGKVFK